LLTLKNTLLVRVQYGKVREFIPRLSLVSACKTYVANIYRAVKVPTTSAIRCILYVLRLLARILVSSKPILVKLKALIDILL
jgi:hypothetical protein